MKFGGDLGKMAILWAPTPSSLLALFSLHRRSISSLSAAWVNGQPCLQLLCSVSLSIPSSTPLSLSPLFGVPAIWGNHVGGGEEARQGEFMNVILKQLFSDIYFKISFILSIKIYKIKCKNCQCSEI
jgi:hypothetical protein